MEKYLHSSLHLVTYMQSGCISIVMLKVTSNQNTIFASDVVKFKRVSYMCLEILKWLDYIRAD